MHRIYKCSWLVFLSLVLILSACSTSTIQRSPLASPVMVSPFPVEGTPSNNVCALSSSEAVPTPAAGKSAITGVLYTLTGQAVIPETRFYMTPVFDVANLELPSVLAEPDPLKGQILGESDTRGYFELTEIPAGDYYIAVWAPYSWLIVLEPDHQTPRIIHLEAGDRLALGCLFLAWP